MKTMLITTLIIFSQFSFAQAQKKNVRLTHETATEAVEKSKSYERIKKLQAEGKSLTDDPTLAKHVVDTVEKRLTDIVKVDSLELMSLINIDAKLTLSKIFELSSVVADPNANAAEKAEATKALELILLAGKSVKSTAKNEAEASSKLGNARSVRQFANKLAEYTPDLPFSIRVESSPKGNRYLKETQN